MGFILSQFIFHEFVNPELLRHVSKAFSLIDTLQKPFLPFLFNSRCILQSQPYHILKALNMLY